MSCAMYLLPVASCQLDCVRHASRRDFRFLGLLREVFAGIDEPIGLELVLLIVQLAVPPVEREELGVVAALHDFTGLEHENLVGAANRRQAMGDDERRAS